MIRLMDQEPFRGRLMYSETPVGPVGLVENGSALTHLFFGSAGGPENAVEEETPLLVTASEQLSEYFAGRLKNFDLPLAPFGTDFQRRVWSAVRDIPYGETRTYGEVAEAIGQDGSFRAVGQASNRNPLAIIIPCHRVVGRGGELTGYGGGLEVKEFLLRLEQDVICGRARSCPED